MSRSLRQIFRNIPTLILAFILALAVWISAISAADPTEERILQRTIPIQITGQSPSLMLVNELNAQVTLTLAAPKSLWDRLLVDTSLIKAFIDLSGAVPGRVSVPVQIQVNIRPVRVISSTPLQAEVTLEQLASRVFTIQFKRSGEPAAGFLAEPASLSYTSVTVTGPKSQVDQVTQVRAPLEMTQARESINRAVALQALNESELPVSGVTLSPDRVTIYQVIVQRGGYRNVVVKVIVNGAVASGYRLTNITVIPAAVTVYSSDPAQVNALPGYVETAPLNLNETKNGIEIRLPLNLPQNISVVDEQTVLVQVGVTPIEGSLTLRNMKIEVIGLPLGLIGRPSPETVDVILSGPLPSLEGLRPEDVRLVVDLTDKSIGTYQVIPKVELKVPNLRVQSILPETIEVSVVFGYQVTPTPKK